VNDFRRVVGLDTDPAGDVFLLPRGSVPLPVGALPQAGDVIGAQPPGDTPLGDAPGAPPTPPPLPQIRVASYADDFLASLGHKQLAHVNGTGRGNPFGDKAWDPAEPRDRSGRWTSGGSGDFAHVPGVGLVSNLTGDLAHLNDEQYAAHTRAVEQRINDALRHGESTDTRYAVDVDRGIWQPERARIHREIVSDLYDRHSKGVPSDGEAVIAGGLGGAGKGTVLKGPAGIDQRRYITLNPDDVKEEMVRRGLVPHVEGLSPMEASPLIHEESSHITNLLAKQAYADRKNVIWDITMSSRGSVQRRIAELREAGYTDITGLFVEIALEKSVERALARHRRGLTTAHGGRYVPPSIIRKNASSRASSANREVFDALRDRFDHWSLYDNSGSAPHRIGGSSMAGAGRG
jgi:predicted ABC-type ATPase